METKSSIRRTMLALRDAMDSQECIQKSVCIQKRLLDLQTVASADIILGYASYKSEVITTEIIKEFLVQGKQVYLPRVSGDEMDFYRIFSFADLSEGYKGIPEPSLSCKDRYTKEIGEAHAGKVVMLLPGAAFSKSGVRVGYGKGYYDRFLEKLPCGERIALCYEFQVVDEIVADVHDIPVTGMVTEHRVWN